MKRETGGNIHGENNREDLPTTSASETKPDTSAEEAFEEYNGPLIPTKIGSITVDLTQAQVLAVKKLSFHASQAIASEIKRGTPAKEAFKKYNGKFTTDQIEGLELNLKREQVETTDFTYSTLNAIKFAVKHGTPVEEAYEKYINLTDSQIKAMESETKRDTSVGRKVGLTDLNKMKEIRIVDSKEGMSQVANIIILMKELRKSGFKGEFDIHCANRRKLEKEITNVTDLGAMKISSLKLRYEDMNKLLPVGLAMQLGEPITKENKRHTLNASNYVSLKLPDGVYRGECSTINHDGKISYLELKSKEPDMTSMIQKVCEFAFNNLGIEYNAPEKSLGQELKEIRDSLGNPTSSTSPVKTTTPPPQRKPHEPSR